MRRAVVTSTVTVAGVILLLSLKPHGSAAAQSRPVISSDPGAAAASAPPAASSSASSVPPSSPSGSATPGSTATRTVTGSAIDTRYGPVQVRITLTGSRLTKVDVLQYPSESGRDAEISNFALPQLNQEAIAAQSAQIDSVSGATYTSDGYLRSLQSALDQAGR